jgi:hypothetical protein
MPNSAIRLAPAPFADNGKLDDFVIASTISEMQRDREGRPLAFPMSSGVPAMMPR